MHLKPISRPQSANLRSAFELVLLFLDIVHSTIGVFRKEPFDGGHDDDDDHDGHTH